MEKGLDRQVEFERLFMDDSLLYGDDWYIDDITLDFLSMMEYSMYESDCGEVLMENAE